MKLTAQTIRTVTAPAGKADYIVWDDAMPGFGLRIRGDRKGYLAQYRLGQQQRRIGLGDVRKVRLEDARANARQIFAKVALGMDPGAEKAKAREGATVVRLTLGDVAARYLDAKKDTLRPSTLKSTERNLHVHFGPLAGRPLAEIKRVEIAARLQEIVKQFGRTAAARARSTLSTLFIWALREGLIETGQNPVTLVNDPLAGIDNSRDRVLSDAELVKVWNACADDDFGRIVRLLILTGLRRDEAGSLKWGEIDLDAGTLTISAERSKNRKAHSLTLPPMALDILRAIPSREGRDYVFGRSGHGFQRWGAYTTALRERLGEMPPFTLHDLRRTFRTGLGRLGIPSHVAELAINHTRGGIEAVYDRHTYQREIASALALWADHVLAAVENRARKVVSLRTA
jgi:integrase